MAIYIKAYQNKLSACAPPVPPPWAPGAAITLAAG